MTIVIRIYFLLCLSLLLFDILFLMLRSRKNLAVYRKNRAFEKKVRGEIETFRETGAFSASFADDLSQKLSKTRNLLTLQNVIENAEEEKAWFRPFIYDQMENYAAKDDSVQAYYTYVLSTFDYGKDPLPAETANALLRFLETKSLYTFANTMMCLYAVGQTAPLMRAIDKVNERGDFYQKKLLVDGLLTVSAEKDGLNAALAENFHRYKPYMQDCLLDYFRLAGYDASELCMEILKSGKIDTQVGYSAMRYFARYPDADSRRYFLEVLSDEKSPWIPQLLAVQALKRYDDEEVFKAISEKISSPNFHIRTNAVEYLHDNGLNKEQVFDILYRKDRYANESLLYQYRGNKEMTRYIIDTIQLLNTQDGIAEGRGDIDALCGSAPSGTV